MGKPRCSLFSVLHRTDAYGYRKILRVKVVGIAIVQTAVLTSRSTPKWLLRRLSGLLGRQVR